MMTRVLLVTWTIPCGAGGSTKPRRKPRKRTKNKSSPRGAGERLQHPDRSERRPDHKTQLEWSHPLSGSVTTVARFAGLLFSGVSRPGSAALHLRLYADARFTGQCQLRLLVIDRSVAHSFSVRARGAGTDCTTLTISRYRDGSGEHNFIALLFSYAQSAAVY